MKKGHQKPTPPPKVQLKKADLYCLPCGIDGRAVIATTEVDGDPMCPGCAHAATLAETLGNSAAADLAAGRVELDPGESGTGEAA